MQARSSDRALHGARRGAEAALRPALLRDRADRSRPRPRPPSASRKSPRPSSNAGCAGRSRPSSASAPGARCAPSPINCRRWNARSTSSSPSSAPQDRRLGVVLRRHHPRLRQRARAHYPMPLPVIARSVEESGAADEPGLGAGACSISSSTPTSASSASARSATRPLWCRTASSRGRRPRRCARPARSAKSPAGHSIRQGRCSPRATNQRVAAAPLRRADNRLVIGVAMGPSRRAPLRAALDGTPHFRPGHRRGDRGAFASAMSCGQK